MLQQVNRGLITLILVFSLAFVGWQSYRAESNKQSLEQLTEKYRILGNGLEKGTLYLRLIERDLNEIHKSIDELRRLVDKK